MSTIFDEEATTVPAAEGEAVEVAAPAETTEVAEVTTEEAAPATEGAAA